MTDGRKIGEDIGIKWEDSPFTLEQFQIGIDEELKEHGTDVKTKVIKTATEAGKVAWAHLKEDPKYYDKLAVCIESVEDLQNLINEATPESARDRVRRHANANQNTVRSHQDEEGHSDMKPPVFSDRIDPSRKPEDRTQMQHGGKSGHRHSSRTQKGQPKRFIEAIDFLREHIGKPLDQELLAEIEDRQALHAVATKLMGRAGINRDWLSNLCDMLGNKQWLMKT